MRSCRFSSLVDTRTSGYIYPDVGHIRHQADPSQDYKIFDPSSVALESGRYMETLGFQSISGLSTGGSQQQTAKEQSPSLTFLRRYIDNNLFSMYHHSGKDANTFPTSRGLNASHKISEARRSLDLGKTYGCAPHDLWVSRRPYPHPESIFSWIETELVPQSIETSKRIKQGGKALVLTNTGAIRFDIFKGAFTKDTKFLVSPFTSSLRMIKDVPYTYAKQVLSLLNHEGPIMLEMAAAKASLQPPEMLAAQHRPHLLSTNFPFEAQDKTPTNPQAQHPLSLSPSLPLFPGYTTLDDAGSDGDDTVHAPIPFYRVPNCIQSPVGFDASDPQEPQTVDVMYNEFLQKWVLMALEFVGGKYTLEDTEAYDGGKSFTDIMTEWVSEHWACPA